MHSKKFILSESAFARAKQAMLTACVLVAGSNVLIHVFLNGRVNTMEIVAGTAFLLWFAFCFTRLHTYSTVSLIVIGDGTVQVFDGMLKDLGTYRATDVKCDCSKTSGLCFQLALQLPEVGTVKMLSDDADATEILRSGGVELGTVSRTAPSSLLALSVIIALTVGPLLPLEVFRAFRQPPCWYTLGFLMFGYVGLIIAVLCLRSRTTTQIAPLMRRIFF